MNRPEEGHYADISGAVEKEDEIYMNEEDFARNLPPDEESPYGDVERQPAPREIINLLFYVNY